MNNHEQHEKLIQLIRELMEADVKLREKHNIGDKFRFVRDKLQTLLNSLENSKPVALQSKHSSESTQSTANHLVYVYLFNAQGNVLRSWNAMLTPKVFYEYSINRPIYGDKSHIEALLRSKANKLQHGYLTIAVNPEAIVSTSVTDAAGNQLLKVKEGSLKIINLVSFTHNTEDYILNAQGELQKKT